MASALERINAITESLANAVKNDRLLEDLARSTAEVVQVERCSIVLWRGGRVEAVAVGTLSSEAPEPPLELRSIRPGSLVADSPLLSDVTRRDGPPKVPVLDAGVLLIRLVQRDVVVGTLCLDNGRSRRVVTEEQIVLATAIAGQVALAVENARLFETATDQACTLAVLLEETERRRASAERLATALREKNAELDTFVYRVSHDLKAPLLSIDALAQVLAEDYAEQLGKEGGHYLSRVRANVQRMERLIDDLLVLSRVGRDARLPEDVDVAEVIAELAGALEATLRERTVRVSCQAAETIHGVRSEVEQVLGNLIQNAVKYMGDNPEPRIEVATYGAGDFVQCFVRDNGIGIDPAYHERIFEIFVRVQDIESAGSGVGLTIVKKIVESAGGRVWVESSKGKGSTFYFTWPRSGSGSPDAAA